MAVNTQNFSSVPVGGSVDGMRDIRRAACLKADPNVRSSISPSLRSLRLSELRDSYTRNS
jgi:hypothetical protein